MKSKFPASWQVIGRAVVDWWDGWFDLLSVVIVWLIAQFTIVLGPPATFGLYHVVYLMVNGESTGVRGLIEGGRKYFGAAWLWNAINLAVLITLAINIRFYSQFVDDWRYFIQILMVVLMVLWLVGQFYALPFFHEQKEARVLTALKNGLLMALATPFFSFVLMVVSTILVVLCGILVLPIFLGVPALIPVLGVRAVQNRLESFGIRKPDKTPKELEREASGHIQVPGRFETTNSEGQTEE